eukprot:9500402-Pyramimonas_sp.AAC.1
MAFWTDSGLTERGSPGTAFWHDSGSSKRNSHVDSWRWNPDNGVGTIQGLQALVSKQDTSLSGYESVLGPVQRKLGRSADPHIVDKS